MAASRAAGLGRVVLRSDLRHERAQRDGDKVLHWILIHSEKPRNADPQFPQNLLRSLRKGQVRVHFMVQPDGSVAEPTVVTSSNARLNAAALAAVVQWRFAPLHQAQPGAVDLGFDLD